jgi:biopolymer transport protein ExbD
MISKGTVILLTLAAAGAGWAGQEYVYSGWTPPQTTRIKRAVRMGGPVALTATPAPADPSTAPAGKGPGAAPAAKDPKAGKPAVAPTPAPAPEPPKPEPPAAKVRQVTDVKLCVAAHGQELTLPRFREVHVNEDGEMTWHGEGGKTTTYNGYKHLGEDLRRVPDAFVIVATPESPWGQIRTMLLEGQYNLAWNAYFGVAKEGEPDVLRLLPIPQTERPDEPLPEGTFFHIVMTSKDGPVELTVNDKKLEAFPADLAQAWNDWKKEHADLADTSKPEKSKVVFEAPKTATVARIVEVVDVLRGLGIESERLGGPALTRPRK